MIIAASAGVILFVLINKCSQSPVEYEIDSDHAIIEFFATDNYTLGPIQLKFGGVVEEIDTYKFHIIDIGTEYIRIYFDDMKGQQGYFDYSIIVSYPGNVSAVISKFNSAGEQIESKDYPVNIYN